MSFAVASGFASMKCAHSSFQPPGMLPSPLPWTPFQVGRCLPELCKLQDGRAAEHDRGVRDPAVELPITLGGRGVVRRDPAPLTWRMAAILLLELAIAVRRWARPGPHDPRASKRLAACISFLR
jgi:hypothetical protein